MINKLITLLIAVLTICFIMVKPVSAEVVSPPQQFTAVIPETIDIVDIGISPQSQMHGKTNNDTSQFNFLVSQSIDGNYWELTTTDPIGVSISYNAGGSIIAVFVSMTRTIDGYQIPQPDISVYPSKVFFDIGPEGGDYQRIFHFSPIIRVNSDTPPGHYMGEITFTVLGQ